MRKPIARNIAIVSAIFVVVFSTMLITNYFQVRGSVPLQTEVIESLKQLNDDGANNPELKEQIRQLDLLARKAYFISHERLMAGIYILLGMVIALVVSLRYYYAEVRNIPDKEIDPIDDWAIKTSARKYVHWIGGGLIAAALAFAFFTSPWLRSLKADTGGQATFPEMLSSSENAENVSYIEPLSDNTAMPQSNLAATQPEETKDAAPATGETSETTPAIEISRVTHNSFRGNNSLGISAARNVPTSWDLASGANILWKMPVQRQGFNSPVINGNKVFISGADAEARELYCYELSSGTLLWTLAANNIPGSPAQMPNISNDTGLAASSVTTNGQQVCAIFASGDLICADMDGRRLWAKNIGVPQNNYGYASSLLSYGNTLFIQYDNANVLKVIALDMATGTERWSKTRAEKNASWSSPAMITVNNSPQLILIGNPGVTSYNPSTGELNWRVECMSSTEPTASVTFANGIVFVAAEYANITAINATDGAILWQNNEFLPEIASPVASKDFVFIATTYGVVASFNAQTGEMIKYLELESDFNSSPIIVDDKIYLTCTEGKVFILSATGEINLIHSFDTGEKMFATPAFTDKKIVIRTENSIYCVEAK
jgi:outer membrane protein assembly factor BamB